MLIGGVLAAPFGAILAKRVPARQLMAMVGTLLLITSVWAIWQAVRDVNSAIAGPHGLRATPRPTRVYGTSRPIRP